MTQLDTVTLPDNCYWSDEHTWSPAQQTREPTLTGRLVVDESLRQGGRPITLEGIWIKPATLAALKALERQVGEPMELRLADGRSFTVYWRRGSNSPGVEARPLFEVAPGTTPEFYRITLRLMEV